MPGSPGKGSTQRGGARMAGLGRVHSGTEGEEGGGEGCAWGECRDLGRAQGLPGLKKKSLLLLSLPLPGLSERDTEAWGQMPRLGPTLLCLLGPSWATHWEEDSRAPASQEGSGGSRASGPAPRGPTSDPVRYVLDAARKGVSWDLPRHYPSPVGWCPAPLTWVESLRRPPASPGG